MLIQENLSSVTERLFSLRVQSYYTEEANFTMTKYNINTFSPCIVAIS